jgi:hypothetical protein
VLRGRKDDRQSVPSDENRHRCVCHAPMT